MFVLFLALVFDWIFGDPDALWKRVPHPVVLFGKLIETVDRWRYNERFAGAFEDRSEMGDQVAGGLLLVLLLAASLLAAWLVSFLAGFLGPFWWLIEIPFVAVLIAQKSLLDHVTHVATSLRRGGLEAGRNAVAQIVGRDVSALDESGVSKAAVESLAENFSDGVVAPVFWYALFGLPGILFYKAVNTADSMIGHRTSEYEHFGKPAAILDDIMNWPAARFAAALTFAASFFKQGTTNAKRIAETTMRDAPNHRSPNAGWSEAAFAASLGISLGGPRLYNGKPVAAVPLNAAGRAVLTVADIDRALRLFKMCCFVLMGVVIVFAIIF